MLRRIFLSILTCADMYGYTHMHILTHSCKYHHPHTYTYINKDKVFTNQGYLVQIPPGKKNRSKMRKLHQI